MKFPKKNKIKKRALYDTKKVAVSARATSSDALT